MRTKQSWMPYAFSVLMVAAVAVVIVRANQDAVRKQRDAARQAVAADASAVTSRDALGRRIAKLESERRRPSTRHSCSIVSAMADIS